MLNEEHQRLIRIIAAMQKGRKETVKIFAVNVRPVPVVAGDPDGETGAETRALESTARAAQTTASAYRKTVLEAIHAHLKNLAQDYPPFRKRIEEWSTTEHRLAHPQLAGLGLPRFSVLIDVHTRYFHTTLRRHDGRELAGMEGTATAFASVTVYRAE